VDAHEPRISVDDAPGVHRHAETRPGDLAVAGPTAELRGQLDHLRQPGGPERVAAATSPPLEFTTRPGESMPVAPAS